MTTKRSRVASAPQYSKPPRKIGVFDVVETPPKHRIETLSDGIFAVAMTLLILDVKLPPVPHEISPIEYFNAVFALWPKIGIFIASFVVLARAWEVHRYIFHSLIRSDHVLLYTNAVYLLSVIFLPFTTSLVGDHPNLSLSAAIYSCNYLALAGFPLLMWLYATRQHRLVASSISPAVVDWVKKRLSLSVVVFTITLAISPFSSELSVLLIFLYQLVMLILPLFHRGYELRSQKEQ